MVKLRPSQTQCHSDHTGRARVKLNPLWSLAYSSSSSPRTNSASLKRFKAVTRVAPVGSVFVLGVSWSCLRVECCASSWCCPVPGCQLSPALALCFLVRSLLAEYTEQGKHKPGWSSLPGPPCRSGFLPGSGLASPLPENLL